MPDMYQIRLKGNFPARSRIVSLADGSPLGLVVGRVVEKELSEADLKALDADGQVNYSNISEVRAEAEKKAKEAQKKTDEEIANAKKVQEARAADNKQADENAVKVIQGEGVVVKEEAETPPEITPNTNQDEESENTSSDEENKVDEPSKDSKENEAESEEEPATPVETPKEAETAPKEEVNEEKLVGSDVYTAKTNSRNVVQYRKNGTLIKKAEYNSVEG